ncbi:aldehyde dehydrogenase family protein [Variovorax guangxiensis]|uniref:aldehyde dehydrogenase family protein n=1 Tax=Variovorax guangxiensis TaxID=1775474 RepID=UPI00285D20EF|nr:aldehyde dehydrogenase family protein [Variovorax guangxiensis]MDR6860477.1 acyl-CoA reductase-like NAD-dependent aldehyde dehydrogenase [Variovorax guangxiensis]
MPVTRLNFIDGEWLAAASGRTYQRLSPYDQSVAGIYQDSDVDDAERAIDAARRSFDTGPWPRWPAAQRAIVFKRAAALLRERRESISTIMAREVGQPRLEQLKFVLGAADTLEFYANLIVSRRDEAVYGQHPDAVGIVAKEPVGVVGSLTAWNTPLSVAHKCCPAMAVGCTLVVKPGHQSPGALIEFASILQEAGLPPGVFNVVTSAIDNGAVVGQAIAGSERVDMVTFTGSSTTGKAVMRAAANNLKRVKLELGGKSPQVIFADAPSLDTAAGSVAKGIVRLAGQSCQAGSRVLVQKQVKAEFVEHLLAHIAATKMGDPLAEETTCGPLVSEDQLHRVEAFVKEAQSSARLLAGGKRPVREDLAQGFFFEPTVFDDVSPDSRIAREEVFGPVLSILTFDDVEDGISLANQTVFGLVAGCWTQSLATAMAFATKVRAGMVWVNGYRDDSILKHMPVGGFKQSGIGREMGPEGLDEFLETKSIMIRHRL